ncbi:MAG: GAF domain-containing protein [Myxococcota bacterium]
MSTGPMDAPGLSDAERARLEEIARLRIPELEHDHVLDAIVREAAEATGAPIALATAVLDDAQFFLAGHGVGGWLAAARGTPRSWSFCTHAIQGTEPFVIHDATEMPEHADNPLVRNDGVRAYTGIPLITGRGHAVGTLCVADGAAGTLSETQVAVLKELASRVIARLEERVQDGS